MTHPTARLGDVAEFIRGITFKPDDVVPLDADDAVVCIRTKNVQSLLDCDDLLAVPSKFVRRKDQYLYEGDILVSSANSWNLVGKCCWVPLLPWRAAFGGFISVLRGNAASVDRRYLYWWFASERIQAVLRSFGQKTTNISNLNIERCLQLELPLPPLPEQRRIAALLDKADALRTKRREALAQLDRLAQSIFVEMFGDVFINAKGFPVSRLGDCCDVRDGTHDSPAYVAEGYPLVTSRNLRDGKIDLSDVNYISEDDYNEINRRSKVDVGDVLMPMIGTIGNPVLVEEEPFFAIKNMALIKFTPISPSQEYVLQFLRSDCFDRLVASKNKGGTQKFLALGDIRGLPLPVPSKASQLEFSRRVEAISRKRKFFDEALYATNGLFASLQHRAFRGEL